MHSGKFVFTQVMDHLPWYTFDRCVQRYDGDRKVKIISMFGSLSLHGLCTTDLSRGPA